MICTKAFLTQKDFYSMYMYIVNNNYHLLGLVFSLLFFVLYHGILSLVKVVNELQNSDKDRIMNEIISFFYILYFLFSSIVRSRISQISFVTFQYLIIIYCYYKLGQLQNTIPNVNKYLSFLTREITFLFIFAFINYQLYNDFGKKSIDSFIFINSLLITNEIIQCIFSHFIIAYALTHQENFDNFIFKMNNLLNMIFSELRVLIPLFISIYYIVKKGFSGNAALISLLQTIAFINGIFFLPTLIKFFKRMRLNKKIEKIFRTANEKDLRDNDICIICRLQMYPKKAKKLPCKHCYHLECLERWIGENDFCPICLEKISDLLDKEIKKKGKRSKRRKHRKVKNQNESDVYNYADLANEIEEKDDNELAQHNGSVDTSIDDIDNNEVQSRDINILNDDDLTNDEKILNGDPNNYNNNSSNSNEELIEECVCNDNTTQAEEFCENNNEKVIDLDKLCSKKVDDNDYYCEYSYSDYSDGSVEP